MTVEGFLYSVILVPHICKLMYAYPRLGPEFHKFPKGRKPSLRLLALNNPCHPYNGVRGHRELQDSSVICVHGLHIWEIKLGFFSYILSGTISLMHIHNTLSRPSWPTFYLYLLSLPHIFTFDLTYPYVYIHIHIHTHIYHYIYTHTHIYTQPLICVTMVIFVPSRPRSVSISLYGVIQGPVAGV